MTTSRILERPRGVGGGPCPSQTVAKKFVLVTSLGAVCAIDEGGVRILDVDARHVPVTSEGGAKVQIGVRGRAAHVHIADATVDAVTGGKIIIPLEPAFCESP